MEIAKRLMSPKVWIILGVVAFAGTVIYGYSQVLALRTEGNVLQNSLTQSYNDSKTVLGGCLDKSTVMADIALEGDASTKDVLTGVMSQFKPDATVTHGMMVTQVAKFFPDLDRTLWNQLGDTAIGCRTDFTNAQRDSQARARVLNDWIDTEVMFLQSVKDDFPNDQLVVIGPDGSEISEDAALAFIMQPVVTSDANEAFEMHEMPGQDLFGNS